MKKRSTVLAAGLFATSFLQLFGLLLVPQTAHAEEPSDITAQCQSMESPTVRMITQERVLLSHDAGGAIYDVSVEIPAGTYKISAFSFEDHVGAPWDHQQYEQWRIRLFETGATTPVFESRATPDVPDGQNLIQAVLEESVTIPAISKIEYVHDAYGIPEKNIDPWNSVYPSCLSFELLTPEQEVEPATCTLAAQVVSGKKVRFTVTTDLSDPVSYQFEPGMGDVSVSQEDAVYEYTYADFGTYTAVATVYNANEQMVACEKSLTLTAGSTGVLGANTGSGTTSNPTSNPTSTPSPTPQTGAVLGAQTLAATGSTQTVGIIVVGLLLSVAGLVIGRKSFVKNEL